MLEINVPGYRTLALEHLVLDFNGTLACDGALLQGVAERLDELSGSLGLHVLTADTFGTVRAQLAAIRCELRVLPQQAQDTGKRDYVEALGAGRVVCIGNGRNDRLMLKTAALGVLVVQQEGAAIEALSAADVLSTGIVNALDLLLQPQRLVATLRA